MLTGNELTQLLDLQVVPAVDAGLGAVRQDIVEVAPVGQLGMR